MTKLDVNLVPEYLKIATVAMPILTFFGFSIYNLLFNNQNEVSDLIKRGLSAGLVPTGILLIMSAFKIDLLKSIESLGVYLGIAGCVLVFIAIYETFAPGSYIQKSSIEGSQKIKPTASKAAVEAQTNIETSE